MKLHDLLGLTKAQYNRLRFESSYAGQAENLKLMLKANEHRKGEDEKKPTK